MKVRHIIEFIEKNNVDLDGEVLYMHEEYGVPHEFNEIEQKYIEYDPILQRSRTRRVKGIILS